MIAPLSLRLLVALLLGLAAAGPVRADDGGGSGSGDDGAASDDGDADHDLARDLVAAGVIRPLGEIVRVLTAAVPGRIVGIRLEREDDRWIYAFRLVTPDGRRVRVKVDAATMAIREGDD